MSTASATQEAQSAEEFAATEGAAANGSVALPDVQVPDIYADQVHASRKGATLDKAVEQFVTPFVDTTGAGNAPLLRAMHLASNVNVTTGSALTGFVALVEGAAPAAPLLKGDRLGEGITWFRLQNVDEAKMVHNFSSRAAPGFSLAEVAAKGRVSVVKGTEYPSTVHYLVVEANDAQAARALREAASKAQASVKDVLKTNGDLKALYAAVFRSSRELRNTMASQFAQAHDLSIDASVPAGDMDKTILQYSAMHSERSGSANRSNRDAFLLYDNVIDTNEAHAGIMAYRGPIAGYTLITGRPHTVQGKPSFSWDNSTKDRRFSMFPADTGLYLGAASARIPDRHAGSSQAIREAAKERIRWSGPVKSYNPLAEQVYHSPTDAALIAVQSALGAAPGGAVEFTVLDTIATEIEGLDTKEQSLGELVQVLDRSNETALPVKTNGDVFLGLLKNWPAVRQRSKSKTLAEVFADERDDHVLVQDHVLRAIAEVCGDEK